MKSIAQCMGEMLEELGIDRAKTNRINDNNLLFRKAICSIWKDKEASDLIFSHTNAFYVRKVDTPRIGIPLGTEYYVCEICVDDALVRSEIDTHKELLTFVLRTQGIEFEELRIISAKGNMLKRHPFKQQ